MVTRRARLFSTLFVLLALVTLTVTAVSAQGLGGAGTIQGTVKDPTGGVMRAVVVRISNALSGYSRTTVTDESGRYVFSNLPPNPYHIVVEAQGFETLQRDVDVRTGVPITLDLSLNLTGATTSVEVVGHAEDLLERDPSAPSTSTPAGSRSCRLNRRPLNQVITLASPGVVSDSNGFFIRSAITPRRSFRSTTSRLPISRAASIRTRSRLTQCSRWK